MVGWNIAATQLVADRVHHKISDFVHFTSATVNSVNKNDEHVKGMLARMYDVSAMPDRCLHLCMINVHVCMFKHSILAIM